MIEPAAPSETPRKASLLHRWLFRALKWTVLALSLFATAGLSGYLSMRRAVRGGEVAVPSLEGKSIEEANRTARQAGLVLETSGERTDERMEAGKILVQDPPGGAKLKRNRKIKVVVSLGTEVIQVPALGGQPARRAQIALQQAGLRVGEISYAFNPRLEGDRVVAQEPPPGSRRMKHQPVSLMVSKGAPPRTWVMPEVEGREIGKVTRFFSGAGFRVGNLRKESAPGVAPGIILKQYPLSGFPLREGDSINLVVSAEGEENG